MSVFLIDGNSYVYRAFYAMPGLTDSAGTPTGAVFGFTNMLLKIIREKSPDCVVVSFDTKAPTARHEMYEHYKANRAETPMELIGQIPTVKQVLSAMNIPIFEAPGYEADDVLATLAARAEQRGLEALIVSGDKDMLQLVRGRVKVYDPMKDKVLGVPEVIERFGVPPERVTEYMALVGDAADNIPGVKGIGDKTARELLSRFNSIDDLIAHSDRIEKPRIRKLIEDGVEDIRLSQRLAEIDHAVPIADEAAEFTFKEPDWQALREIFARLGFTSLMRAIPQESSSAKEGFECMLDIGKLNAALKGASGSIAFDTETTGTDPMRDSLVGFSMRTDKSRAFYVPLTHSYLGVPGQIRQKDALDAIRPLMQDGSVAKYAHNIKFDMMMLRRSGLEVRGRLMDTMIASYLLSPERQSHSLEAVALEHLGHTKKPYSEVAGKAGFDTVDIERATQYAAEDSELAYELGRVLFGKLKAESLDEVYDRIEMPLIRVLADMEEAGLKLDIAKLAAVGSEISESLGSLTKRIYFLAGHEFNINSPKQLAHVLFEELGLSPGKKKKTGFSTDADVLDELSKVHELPAEVLEWRKLMKLSGTYVEALPKLVHPQTGRLHTSFNQAVTATGRLSSSEPNLQNIPVRGHWGTRIRECFTAEPGCVVISADYSQIELRILAHLSGDAALKEAFQQGRDIHSQTAAWLFETPAEKVSADMRRVAKTVNFGVLYGMSAFGLSGSLGISRAEAERFIERYFAAHPGVVAYIDKVIAEGTNTGCVSTMFGRKRYIPELRSSNRNTRMLGERLAVNSPVQGSAADIIKIAMIDLHERLQGEDIGARLVLQVHDELIVEAPDKHKEAASLALRKSMESAASLDVPLSVDLGVGQNWAEAH